MVLSLRVTLDRREAAGQTAQRCKHEHPSSPVEAIVSCYCGLSPQTGAKPVDLCVFLLSQGSRGQDGLPGSDGEPGEDVSAFALKSGPCGGQMVTAAVCLLRGPWESRGRWESPDSWAPR